MSVFHCMIIPARQSIHNAKNNTPSSLTLWKHLNICICIKICFNVLENKWDFFLFLCISFLVIVNKSTWGGHIYYTVVTINNILVEFQYLFPFGCAANHPPLLCTDSIMLPGFHNTCLCFQCSTDFGWETDESFCKCVSLQADASCLRVSDTYSERERCR